MTRARIAAQTVPKTRGPTYDQKFVVSRLALSPVATKAGRLCAMRKMATAASVTRIMLPANTAEREKTRSPRLSTGLAAGEVTGYVSFGGGWWGTCFAGWASLRVETW